MLFVNNGYSFPVENDGGGGSGTVDQTARDDIAIHVQNNNIHVTAAEKAMWDGKAELTDIPTKLPANGGDADTVDGKHDIDFARNFGYWRDAKSIRDYISEVNTSGFCLISTLVTDMPIGGAAWLCVINCSNGSKQITAYKISSNKPCAYSMAYLAPSDTWYDWVCLADGGNAASVGAYTEAKIAALEARIAALENGGTT